ncbi:MAG: multicopper oxidase domain-containing protein, partial [Proteobacteria bacterium]|nr:multicopper oxidase domain-containing protein [Pseudomonadota bacterium]
SGCFMYHPHADEMVQMAMGMMGLWITHPKDPNFMKVDRDFCFLLGSFDIDPGSYTPKISTMLDFNLWTFNTRVFPGIDHLVCRLGDKVRIRVGNLTMTNHPIHLHGHNFEIVGTDGGWTNPSARWPEVTTDIAVGQMRAIEFTATEPGDWAFHCHKSHHTMNAMSHTYPNMIGANSKKVTQKIKGLIPDYMAMGESGMSEMSDMKMPLPENTLPMMTGTGQFGPLEMGGMFTVVKVRKDQPPNNYTDPGWYKFPSNTVAYEWKGNLSEPVRAKSTSSSENATEVKIRKPEGHNHH